MKKLIKKLNRELYKKYVCMPCMFVSVFLASVLLYGCASAQDEVLMALDSDKTAVSDTAVPESTMLGTANKDVADVPFSGEALTETEPPQVYIYVCGAVELPGVYCLRQGSRLYEAVELAGGLTGDADENCLNMAREIADGEQVVILTQEEAALLKESGNYPGQKGEQQGAEASASGLVNINTASLAELTTVSGIGEGRAQAIIAYREQNGSFQSIEDIKKVDGIKDGLFSKIKDKITV